MLPQLGKDRPAMARSTTLSSAYVRCAAQYVAVWRTAPRSAASRSDALRSSALQSIPRKGLLPDVLRRPASLCTATQCCHVNCSARYRTIMHRTAVHSPAVDSDVVPRTTQRRDVPKFNATRRTVLRMGAAWCDTRHRDAPLGMLYIACIAPIATQSRKSVEDLIAAKAPRPLLSGLTKRSNQ